MSKEKKMIPELRFPEFIYCGEWYTKILGDIGDFTSGGTPDTNIQEYWNGGIQWYTPTEVKEGILGNSIRTISEEGLKNSSAKLLPKGALLITTRATIGDIAISNFECTTNQGFQSLVVKNSEVNTFWYYWIIQHKNELIKKASGSTFPEIGKNEIVKIKVACPNKDEQQKIASCLSSLDEVIAAHTQKLELLKDHKKGLMQNLFPQLSELGFTELMDYRISENASKKILKSTNPKNPNSDNIPKYRFPEFLKDEVWVEINILDIASLKARIGWQNLRKEEHLVEGIYFLVTGTDFINNKIDWEKVKYVSYERYIQDENIILQNCDILITKDGSIGKVAYVENLNNRKSTLNNGIFRLRVDINKNNPEFIFHSFLSQRFTSFLDRLSGGSSIVHLYQKDFEKYKIIVPKSKKEQQKIASCLSSLDAIITTQADKIEQLKLHKKGLMQGLFPQMSEQ